MEMKQYLYIMRNAFNLYKIGIATDVNRRRKQVENSSGAETEILHTFDTYSISAEKVEKFLHSYFDNYRTKGEWFTNIDIHFIKNIVGMLEDENVIPEPTKTREYHGQYRQGTYLAERYGVYYFQIRHRGKILKRSLRTRDKDEAEVIMKYLREETNNFTDLSEIYHLIEKKTK